MRSDRWETSVYITFFFLVSIFPIAHAGQIRLQYRALRMFIEGSEFVPSGMTATS